MYDQISMSISTMELRSAQAKTQHDNVGSVIASMDKLLVDLQREWKGAAEAGYETRYKEIRKSLVNAQALLDEISHNLKATANILKDTDTNIGNQFKK